MKKLFLITILLLLATAFVYVGCKDENDNPPPEEEIFGDSQTEEQNQAIDSCSVSTPPMDSILDVNGIPYGNKKASLSEGSVDKLVLELISFTHAKCQEKQTIYHSESLPEHYGYAYSYGQRNMQKRLHPGLGNSLHNTDAVWGTDCSGLLINAIRNAGVDIDNCNSLSIPNYFSIALSKSDEYKDLVLEDEGQLSIWQIKTGDIVLWPNVPHIGIVGRNMAGDVLIHQSNGTGYPKDEGDQVKNWLSETRGSHPWSMVKMLTMTGGWKPPYIVYRLKEKEPDPEPTGFTITTKAITAISENSAQSGGDIVVNSKDTIDISMRGVCWSITANPTVNSSITNDGSGTGSYLSSIEGLTAATTYYVRAYAVSDSKTYYGNQLSFQTSGGGGGGNISTLHLSIDGTSYDYEGFAFGGHGESGSGGYHISYDINDHTVGIHLINQLAVGTCDFTQPCFEGGLNENLGNILIVNMNELVFIAGSSWSTHCPAEGNPNRYLDSYNGTLTITAVNFDMVSGQFNAILDFSNDGSDLRNVSSEFTFYKTILPE